MDDTVIRVENLGKKYIIGHQKQEKYTALRDVIANGTKGVLQSLRNPKSKSQDHQEEFWALKDVSFEIKQGDRVGIIGRNGAGKSTLLKVLSRITEPTKGKIEIHGRVASLLEVGTGFHPELTGRENIFLNGAILGMGKEEIKRKFDEIVAFAEVEKFLDTPVKRYSSGMYVRLAFAVAAHLEPEILIVDEVLAVGDAQFQKKCLGKMEDISVKEQRTILFVSHNIGAINQLTSQALLLNRGHVINYGYTSNVVKNYLKYGKNSQSNYYQKETYEFNINKDIEFCEIKLLQSSSNKINFEISYIVRNRTKSVIGVEIINNEGIAITSIRDTDNDPESFLKEKGKYINKLSLSTKDWMPGLYFVTFSLSNMVSKRFDFLEGVLSFEIPNINIDKTPGWSRRGVIFSQNQWNQIKINT